MTRTAGLDPSFFFSKTRKFTKYYLYSVTEELLSGTSHGHFLANVEWSQSRSLPKCGIRSSLDIIKSRNATQRTKTRALHGVYALTRACSPRLAQTRVKVEGLARTH